MLTKEILDSHPLKVLKSEIAKQNIKGYSNMKRSELTALMLKHKEKFNHIKAAQKNAPKAPKEKKKPKSKGANFTEKELLSIIEKSQKAGNLQLTKKELLKLMGENTHEMPDGSKMTGKVHSKNSKPIKEKPKFKKISKAEMDKKVKAKAKKEFVNTATGLKSKYDPKKGPKKPRSEKQLANDKKLGETAKAKAAAKKTKK